MSNDTYFPLAAIPNCSIELLNPPAVHVPQQADGVELLLVERRDRDDGLRVTASEFWRSPPTSFHKTVINAVAAAAAEHEYSTHRLWSGAGHDAKYVAERYPAGMIFVPCKGGLSHNEAEWASKEDCARGAAVLLNATQRLANLV